MSRRDEAFVNIERYRSYMEDRIHEGIETNRKGYATVTLKDADGKPVPGAQVHLHQTGHAFKYGANIFMLDQLETKEKNDIYQRSFADTFNMATLPFYWDTLEPEPGKTRYAADSPAIYRRPATDLCLDFCRKNGIEPREHALAYDHFFPAWLRDASDREVKIALEKRYAQIAERYADSIPTIEVTNEMFWDKGVTHFYRADDFMDWTYQMAEKYFPNNILAINDNVVWTDRTFNAAAYYNLIRTLLLSGRRVDAIGMQYHMFFRRENEAASTGLFYNPRGIYDILDHYGKLGRAIHISEVTIPAYSSDPEDEAIQADLVEALYSMWFSHPNVEQIIYWNLVDGYAYNAKPGDMTKGENYYYGGLLRFDLSPKPAFERVQHLFRHVWHTEADITTDRNGYGNFKGFYGTYDVTVTANGKTVTVPLTWSKGCKRDFTITL